MVSGATTESLDLLKEDLDEFLKEEEKKEAMEKAKISSSDDSNPFSALFSFFKEEKKEKKNLKDLKVIDSDTDIEKVIRSQCIIAARKSCYTVYDIYKKQHGMPSLVGYA